MFKRKYNYNNNNDMIEKRPHVETIRNAGYYLPDNVVHQTSTSNLAFAALVIRSRTLVEQDDNYYFDHVVDGEKFIRTSEEEQKRIFYSLYLAQKFVDMVFNERTGIYLYTNKEELQFHPHIPDLFKVFVKGIFIIRELEDMTNTHDLQKNINTRLGENAPNDFFLAKIGPEENQIFLLCASFRGLTISIILGFSVDIRDLRSPRLWVLHDIFNHQSIPNIKEIPELNESNWTLFKKNNKHTYTPLDF